MSTNSDDEQYGENRFNAKLDPKNVPIELHPLISLAERWRETDDYVRGHALEAAQLETLRNLVQAVHPYGELLRKWLHTEYERYRLGGKETKEQAAFLGLEISAVEAQVKLSVKFGEEHEL